MSSSLNGSKLKRYKLPNVTTVVTSAAILLAALYSPGVVQAQTARFLGHVTDPQGAVLPHVPVEIVNVDTGAIVNTQTDDGGSYSAPYLAAGHYKVTVEVPGFDPYTRDVALQVGQALTYDVQLAVGAAATQVNVQESSAAVELNLENSEVGGTITGKEVQGLQLNGRNFSQFIALAPGVSNQTSQDEARVGMAGSVSYSVNGGRTEYNSFEVDGSEILNVGINRDHTSLIVTPSIDAIQEVKVLTSNYSAMYPSTGSGTTVITTKSGTDAYHGSLYEFNRNEAYNAKGYFDIGTRAPLYRRNDFGGTIGGPLSIPHLYDAKGRTHFFFSEEARLEKDPYAYRQGVPSLGERNGDFSDVCPAVATGGNTGFSRAQYPDCPDVGLGLPSNGSVPGTFFNNQLTYPSNTGVVLNQNAVALLNNGIFPLPTATSGCNSTGSACYNAEVSLPTYWREELFRIDRTLSQNWQASFRYIHDEWDETTPVPQYAYTQNTFPTIQNRFYGPGTSLVARLTGAFSSTFLNELVFSYTQSHLTLADVAPVGVSLARPASLDGPCGGAGQQCPMSEIFQNQGVGLNGVPKMPGISIAGNNAEYGGFGFNSDPGYAPWEHTNPTYTIADNLTKTLGRHNLQFGANLVIYQRNQTNGPIGAAIGDTEGLLTFSNQKVNGSTGNAFADFLYTSTFGNDTPGGQGAISSFEQDSSQTHYRQRYKIAEPYIQDDWKATPRLTINAGLRLSLFGNFHEANNRAYNWEASAFNAASAATLSATGPNGSLLDIASNTPIMINQANPSSGLDPRILNGIVQCGTGNRPASCMSGHLVNPSPRVGFAWDPEGNGKTAIRAGYGIFFEHGTSDESNTGSLEGAAPVVLDMTEIGPSGWSTIGGGLAFPLNVTAIPTKTIWPYNQQWSGSIERQLPGDSLLSVAYVGSKGTHLTAEREINQLAPAASNPFGPHEPLHTKGINYAFRNPNSGQGDCAATNDNRFVLENGNAVNPGDPAYANLVAACYTSNPIISSPNALRTFAPSLGDIYSLENIAASNYNAFQASIRRIKAPVTIGVAYTYSHSFDDASDRSDATFVNSFDIRSNRSSSSFDQRHLLHISYIYDLPLLKFFDNVLHFDDSDPDNQAANYPDHTYDPAAFSSSKIVKAALDGWQFSGITLFESGIPFTVVNNGSNTGLGTLDNAGVANGVGSGSYPDLSGISPHSFRPAGGTNSKSFGPLLLNPAAFIAPRALTFGNAGRNVLNNPHRTNFDAALLKHFPLGEHVQAEFRVESFNLFNHTQFRIYDPALGNQAENEVSCYGGPAAYYSAAGGDGTDCLTGSSFLHPVDAHRPRTIQFALKLAF